MSPLVGLGAILDAYEDGCGDSPLRVDNFVLLLTAASVVYSVVTVVINALFFLFCHSAFTICHMWVPTGHTSQWITTIMLCVSKVLTVFALNGCHGSQI